MARPAAAARIAPDPRSVRRKSSVIRLAMAPVSMAVTVSISYRDRTARQTPKEDRMRLTKPRFAPLSDAEMSDEHREALKDFGPGPLLNIFRTLVRAPKALTRFNAW